MPFDRVFLDELSARNDIVDIVSQYVQLKKSGANYFGLCPFHNEKTASFSVSPDKQIFHCFGCGAGGGVITFGMKAEGLEFPDAVRFLADRAGMQVPEQGEAERKAARHRERLYALCKDAARFYYQTLWQPEHRAARQADGPPEYNTPAAPAPPRQAPYSSDCCRDMDKLPITRPLEIKISGCCTAFSS